MFTDDDLNLHEAVHRIDAATRGRLDALITDSLNEGQEDWQIAEGFVLAGFRVLEAIEDDRVRILYAQHLERITRHVSRKLVEEVVFRRLVEEAASAPGKDRKWDAE